MKGIEVRGVLAKNIRFYRENRLWSQADLASNSEISIPYLSEIERGNKWPFPDTLARIADALNVKIPDLFWEGETPSYKQDDFTNMVIKEIFAAQKAAADNVVRKYLRVPPMTERHGLAAESSIPYKSHELPKKTKK